MNKQENGREDVPANKISSEYSTRVPTRQIAQKESNICDRPLVRIFRYLPHPIGKTLVDSYFQILEL